MIKLDIEGKTYKTDAKIGQGCTANVYLAISSEGKTLCVKVISPEFIGQPAGKELIENEIKMLKTNNHPNLLHFIKHEAKEKTILVTQYCSGGTLYEFLKIKGKITETDSLPIVKQIVEGLKSMHTKGIIHRDLKPQNIFFSDKTKKTIKIADFGFATELSNKKMLKTNVGSPLYMPYEALTSLIFSEESDIFAVGVIWFQLLTGRTPFEAKSEVELKEKIKKGEFRRVQLNCCQGIYKLIKRCLNFNISERPSLKEIVIGIDNALRPKDIERIKSKSTVYPKTINVINGKKKQPLTLIKDSNKIRESIDKVIARHDRISSHNSKEKASLRTSASIKNINDKKQKQLSLHSSVRSENVKPALDRLTSKTFPFLPLSVQKRLKCFLKKFKCFFELSDNEEPLVQESDEFITELMQCKEEKTFCQLTIGFIRRLIRLAKSYKENSLNISDFMVLYQKIQSVSNSK